MSREAHHALVGQYQANIRLFEKFQKKAVVLEVVAILVVVLMKAIQNTASLRLNFCATCLVGILLFWHLWNSDKQRAVDHNASDLIIEGLKLEKENTSLQLSFFRNWLEEFNPIASLAQRALFDILLVYFFSVSFTQLMNCVNPAIVTKMQFIRPFSTLIILSYLGWIYYKPLRPLIHLKKSAVR